MKNTEHVKKIFTLFFLIFFFGNSFAQFGGIGIKISSPAYHFTAHPGYQKNLNSLYIGIRMGRHISLFVDSYLFKTDGEAFETQLAQPMEQSTFSDKGTVLGPMFHHELNIFDLYGYAGAGLGWHSLRLGYKNGNLQESSKNYGAHGVMGISYDIKILPVLILCEARYSQIFLRNETADPKFSPSPLHQSDAITITSFAIGMLIYFF